MATVKKTVTKATKTKAAAKPKTAAKKPAEKKTAAKTAVKKPAAKTADKKPAVKKTAAVKKPAVKKAAEKTAVKKPAAAKKPAAKTAVTKTPDVKKPIVKTSVSKPAPEKKPAAAEKNPATEAPVETSDPNIKYRNLFDAFAQGKLPFAHGYIVSSFFNPTSAYSIYEIVSYAGVKEIFITDTGLQFITGGKKLYVLVEPDIYYNKPVEPVSRIEGERIPKRFSELETIIAKNQSRIMVAKEPNETYGSFTILKPSGVNFAVVFYQLPNMYASLAAFFEDSLNRQRKIPQSDARKAANLIATTIERSMGFRGEFEQA
ncbi:MAG: hypothetical protein FWC03_11690 [Treponema sp.]|nr:hypothetical protein [Treponema sp.]